MHDYLTRDEVIEALHLPRKLGRNAWESWRMHPGFPKPEPDDGRTVVADVRGRSLTHIIAPVRQKSGILQCQ
jgi:hypothetical protein